MKIVDVTTTMLHDPEGFVIQDATIFPPKEGSKGRNALFVHVKTDEGVESIGTSAGSNAGSNAVRAVIEDTLREELMGRDPFDIEMLWNRMFWSIRGVGLKGVAFCGISAVDIALRDLKAKALNLPLYKLLGPYTDTVPVYGSGGWANFSEAELVAEQMSYVERGMPRIKMKAGKDFGTSEEEDIRRLAAVRKAAGDDIDGLAAISKATTIPVAAGEHEYTKYGFKELITRSGADIVQPGHRARRRRN